MSGRLHRSRSHESRERALALPQRPTASVPAMQAVARRIMTPDRQLSIMDISAQSQESPADVRPVPLHFADIEQSLATNSSSRSRAGEAACSPPRRRRTSPGSGVVACNPPRSPRQPQGVVAKACAAQMQVVLDLEHFDRSARVTRQAIDMPSPLGTPIQHGHPAARFSAPVNCALEEANRRAEAAEESARHTVHRARSVAVNAVAASQIDANARVQEANEAARCAAIQA